MIALNDFASISEAFRKDEFLGRPKSVAFNVLMELQGNIHSTEGFNLIFKLKLRLRNSQWKRMEGTEEVYFASVEKSWVRKDVNGRAH